MARSVRSLALFRCEEDYQMFCMMLQTTKEKYPYLIHSYCLMTTHFHLLITTLEDEICKIMNHFMHNYAMYFNRKYGMRGHVFDSRYVSCLVEDGRYFLEVSRYIHLNPIRAGMVDYPQDYKYSSYMAVLSNQYSELLNVEEVLDYFRGNKTEQYRMFVEGAVSHEEHEGIIQKDIGEDEKWLPW